MTALPGSTIDTTHCESEPIRFSGAIQPHGVLLVVDPQSGAIAAASGVTNRYVR